jgi:NAD(P)-dependent dehydrogenase (short-subunit alcohol dehydrogenase family)
VIDLAGKIAVVTGAASGIGLGVARALSDAGMSVALLDIQRDAVERAARTLAAGSGRVMAATVDVSSPDSMGEAAEKIKTQFGAPHVLVNNAGVAFHGTPLQHTTYQDWQWVIGVNLIGAINGVRSFLPLMQQRGEGGHIVNTASGSGFFIRPGRHQGPYAVTKYAVVAFSEALEQELAGTSIGVSVLCPGAVNTAIHESGKNRPQQFGGPINRPDEAFLKDLTTLGMPVDQIGNLVIRAIRERKFYIFTHASTRASIEARHARILEAFES